MKLETLTKMIEPNPVIKVLKLYREENLSYINQWPKSEF